MEYARSPFFKEPTGRTRLDVYSLVFSSQLIYTNLLPTGSCIRLGGMTMDQQGKNRRFHKKSRKGCLECKRRHIKCDERRPNCGNCDVAARDCYHAYQSTVPRAQPPVAQSPIHLDPTSPALHELSPATSDSPSALRCNNVFTLQHMNLFHYVEVGMAD
ncbi:hypothetical protein GGS26DRAFT_77875 [Hypomontagnella submonticulosa]|nr:hypothetical protein GGS26DRAFT_77875 [Hypomontagnella submonticulosa]